MLEADPTPAKIRLLNAALARFRERGYTASHQVFLDLEPAEAGRLCRDLEEADIFIDAWGRLGTAEVTHLGMGPREMEEAAALIAEAREGRPGRELRVRAAELARRFPRS